MIRSYLPPRAITPDAYRGRIADAQVAAYHWRASEANPDGLAARVVVAVEADDGPAHVVDAIDISHRDRLLTIFGACGLEAPAEPEKSLSSLVGRPCRVVTRNITPKLGKRAGEVKAVVGVWLSPS
jgi:hypothetical protein